MPVKFLWMEGEHPLAIVILITIGAVILLTELIGVSYRRRRRRRRDDKEDYGDCGTLEKDTVTVLDANGSPRLGLTRHVRLVCLIPDLDNNGPAQATCALIGVEE